MFKPMVVDLSHFDNVDSFQDVYNAGIRGVIHKATQGSNYRDSRYNLRKANSAKVGMLWGAYHFGTGTNVLDQVNWYLDTIQYDKNTLLALDFEQNTNGPTMTIAQARKWLELVEAKTGQAPALYSGNLIKENLSSDPDGFWGKHRLWLCQYGPKPKVPSQWKDYWLWQYASDGVGPQPHKIPGITGIPDLNVFAGTEEELKTSWLG